MVSLRFVLRLVLLNIFINDLVQGYSILIKLAGDKTRKGYEYFGGWDYIQKIWIN